MKFVVIARDVNGTVLDSATTVADYVTIDPSGMPSRQLTPLSAGQTLDVQLAGNRIFFTVSATDYSEEPVTILENRGIWLVDNPACVTALSGDIVSVTVTVGNIRFAPTVFLPPDQMIKDNPQAVYVEDVGGSNWIYRGIRINRETIHRLIDPIAGNPDEIEWKRFNGEGKPITIELKDFGLFCLLEYGFPALAGRKEPRFLVFVWVPRVPLGSKPQVMTFYSPTTSSPSYPFDTFPFLRNYPYAFLPLNPPHPIRVDTTQQPYVNLGSTYIDVGYKIIYQLLAAGRNPIVIMPIQASADWGPFASPAGHWRLLKETVRFLYARQLVSGVIKPVVDLRLSPKQTQTFPAYGHFTTEIVPNILSITVSGFSAGINAVVSLCNGTELGQRYKSFMFSAPTEPFTNHWGEIWDIDGVCSTGWSNMLKAFTRWINDDRRRLRSYHSETTHDFSKENGLVEQKRVDRKVGKAGFVEQGTSSDGRITWVGFSNSYLEGNKKNPRHRVTTPEFGAYDAHHMVPAIAFGHAALFPPPPS